MGLRGRWGLRGKATGSGWAWVGFTFRFTSDALITHCLKTPNKGEGGAQQRETAAGELAPEAHSSSAAAGCAPPG